MKFLAATVASNMRLSDGLKFSTEVIESENRKDFLFRLNNAEKERIKSELPLQGDQMVKISVKEDFRRVQQSEVTSKTVNDHLEYLLGSMLIAFLMGSDLRVFIPLIRENSINRRNAKEILEITLNNFINALETL